MFMDERQVSVGSVLGAGAFQLTRFHGQEALGEPYRFTLDLLSERDHLTPEQLLGTEMVLNLEISELQTRQFTGFVLNFSRVGRQGRYAAYRAVLGPWLDLLKYRSDCRIFQGQAVPDIFTAVAQGLGIPVTIEMQLGAHRTRPFTVQYRETDFNFVSRLLQDEGIYYHFTHQDGHHAIRLVDAMASHTPADGYKLIPYYPPTTSGRRDEEHISSWDVNLNLVPNRAALDDYDYEFKQVALARGASKDPQGPASDGQGSANDRLEMYDYPGGYVTEQDAGHAIAMMIERQQTERETISFESNARGLYAGATFSVRGLEIPESDTFLAVSAQYIIESDALESTGEGGGQMLFRAHFEAMPTTREFRPACRARKPEMRGPHSAVVTGPADAEIYTDPDGLGRVLVQFHWDRDADPDKKDTSCWVRVSTPWASGGFGAYQVPRVGDEVLVDFLDGDPDRPVIVGRLYNGQNKPPYKTPTQSGIKTRSSPGGTANNFNEIRFEDRKGKEELHVQAERNHSVLVKSDQSISVGGNRSVTVGKNETITVHEERKTTVTKKDEQVYLDTRSIKVHKTDTLDVVELRTESFHGGRKVTVEKEDNEYVKDATQTITIDKQYNLSANEHIGLTQGGNQMMVKDSVTIKSIGNIVLKNDGCTVTMANDGTMTLEGKAQVKLKSGAASITMTPDGTVTIDGPLGVKMQTGPNAVALSPAGADVKGAVVNVTGMGNVTIMAPIIKVG